MEDVHTALQPSFFRKSFNQNRPKLPKIAQNAHNCQNHQIITKKLYSIFSRDTTVTSQKHSHGHVHVHYHHNVGWATFTQPFNLPQLHIKITLFRCKNNHLYYSRDTTVTSQKHSHGHVHHHHNRMGDVHTALQPPSTTHHHPPQVSLETHQTEKGGPNTTIAATTHHLHECEVRPQNSSAYLQGGPSIMWFFCGSRCSILFRLTRP